MKLQVSSLIIIITSILYSCKKVVHKHINTELFSTLFLHSGKKCFDSDNLTLEIYTLLPSPHWNLVKTHKKKKRVCVILSHNLISPVYGLKHTSFNSNGKFKFLSSYLQEDQFFPLLINNVNI